MKDAEARGKGNDDEGREQREASKSGKLWMAEGMVDWILLRGEQYWPSRYCLHEHSAKFFWFGTLSTMSRYATIFCLLTIIPASSTSSTVIPVTFHCADLGAFIDNSFCVSYICAPLNAAMLTR